MSVLALMAAAAPRVYREARDRRFAGFPERPVATTVNVSGATVDGALILLEAVAVVPE